MAAPVLHRRYESASLTRVDERTVAGIVVPWEYESPVADVLADGSVDAYVEIFTRGAFDNQVAAGERAARSVRFDDGHGNRVGYGLVLRNVDAGLYGEFRVKPSHWDDVVSSIDDGVNGLSAGFKPQRNTFDRGRRRRVRALLESVALEADPAYDTARVLALRSAGLDRLDEPTSADRDAAAAAAAARIDEWRRRLAELNA